MANVPSSSLAPILPGIVSTAEISNPRQKNTPNQLREQLEARFGSMDTKRGLSFRYIVTEVRLVTPGNDLVKRLDSLKRCVEVECYPSSDGP